MSKHNRLQFISVMQVIGMLLIVLSHSISQYAVYPQWTGRFVQMIQYAGLTAFMWCSGYLLVYTKALERHGYRAYMLKRLQRLMLPYVMVQLVMLLPKLVIARMQGAALNIDLVHACLYPREAILPHLWFLPTLTILCLLTPILLKLTEEKTYSRLTLAVLLILAALPDVKNILCLDDVKSYLFWFTLGIVSAKYYRVEMFQGGLSSWKVLLVIPVYMAVFLLVPYSPLKWIVYSCCTLVFMLAIGMWFSRKIPGGGVSIKAYIHDLYPVTSSTECY